MKNYSKKRPEYYTNHYLNHKEEYKDYNERRRELHRREPRIRMFQGLKRRAKRKGFECNLKSYKDLPKVPKFCPILGIPLIIGRLKDGKGGGTDNSPTSDRIDNDKGYIKGNLQIISRKANQMKSNGNFKDIEMLYKYMKKQRRKNVKL